MTIEEWNKLTNKQKLTIVENMTLDEKEIEEFCEDKEMWAFMSYYQHMSEKFIKKHREEVNWSYISIKGPFSREFIIENIDKLQLNNYLSNYELDEDFIREIEPFLNKEAWYNIFKFWNHSIDFIREFLPKVNWLALSEDREFSEKELEEFKHDIAWLRIAPQCVTEKMMDRYFEKINWYEISKWKTFANTEADKNFIRKYQAYLFFPNIDMSVYDVKFRKEINKMIKHREKLHEKFIAFL